tara:strand:+ start:1022 stop:1204 length:183 start_codon:yes stop_codon:yes gene_type:complete
MPKKEEHKKKKQPYEHWLGWFHYQVDAVKFAKENGGTVVRRKRQRNKWKHWAVVEFKYNG